MSWPKSERRRRGSSGAKFAAMAWLFCIFTFVCAFSVKLAHGSETPANLVGKANSLYNERKYASAELLYRDAKKALPESAEISFNLGNVAYRKGDYDAAGESFLKVAESVNASRELRKKALYNLGNCAFQKGEKLIDSDLQKALDSFKLSILRYHDVLAEEEVQRSRSRGKGFEADEDAKYNIEVARLRIKDILDKLKQQEEKKKEQQEKQEEFIKKLKEAIEKQGEIVKDTGDARDRKQRGEEVSQSVDDVRKKQSENKGRTNELVQEIQKQIDAAKAQGDQNKTSRPPIDEKILSAKDSLKESEIEQGTALQHLDRQDLPQAEGSEEEALQNLQDALAKLTKPQPPQPQPGEQQQNEQAQKKQQDQKPPQTDKKQAKEGENEKEMTPEQAQEELAKLRKEASEKRRRNLQEVLRRYPNYRHRRREYEPVDRDW
jgi:hypothetical protein